MFLDRGTNSSEKGSWIVAWFYLFSNGRLVGIVIGGSSSLFLYSV